MDTLTTISTNLSIEDDVEGAWGSSTYGQSNSTANLTIDEILKLMLGPKQV